MGGGAVGRLVSRSVIGMHKMIKGVELKLDRGKRIILACVCRVRAKIFPLSDFPPPGNDFIPLLGILFNFFLFKSLGWPGLQGGNPPPVIRP